MARNSPVLRVSTRNARFQQWSALLTNRRAREHRGEFLVHGVRPITLAVEHGWPIRALLYDASAALSRWASDVLARADCLRVAMAPDLLRELGDKDDAAPELVAVAARPADDLGRISVGRELLAVVLDRPGSPGNIGTVVRSADAFGASGVVVAGHAADPYDPKSVRASTGSLFATPVVRVPSHREVRDWVGRARGRGVDARVLGTDERGDRDIAECDLTVPTVLLIGSERAGLSAGWRELADSLVRIPIVGSASSLNAATAASILLYEAARQRTLLRPPSPLADLG